MNFHACDYFENFTFYSIVEHSESIVGCFFENDDEDKKVDDDFSTNKNNKTN